MTESSFAWSGANSCRLLEAQSMESCSSYADCSLRKWMRNSTFVHQRIAHSKAEFCRTKHFVPYGRLRGSGRAAPMGTKSNDEVFPFGSSSSLSCNTSFIYKHRKEFEPSLRDISVCVCVSLCALLMVIHLNYRHRFRCALCVREQLCHSIAAKYEP